MLGRTAQHISRAAPRVAASRSVTDDYCGGWPIMGCPLLVAGYNRGIFHAGDKK